MNEYGISVDMEDGVVSICLCKDCDYIDGSFINIWVEDENVNQPSPFKSIEDAKLFAEILVKLMRIVE